MKRVFYLKYNTILSSTCTRRLKKRIGTEREEFERSISKIEIVSFPYHTTATYYIFIIFQYHKIDFD